MIECYLVGGDGWNRIPMIGQREEHYRQALEEIAKLVNVTQTRGPMEHWTTPDHLMDGDGWGPIHPRTKDGLKHAARIAQQALDATL